MTTYPELEIRLGGVGIDLNLNAALLITGGGGPLAFMEYSLEHSVACLGSPTPNAPVTIIDADLDDVAQVLAEIPAGKPAILALYPEGRAYDAAALISSLPAHVKLLVISEATDDDPAFGACVRIDKRWTRAGILQNPRTVYSSGRSVRGLAYSQSVIAQCEAVAAEENEREDAHRGLPVEITRLY